MVTDFYGRSLIKVLIPHQNGLSLHSTRLLSNAGVMSFSWKFVMIRECHWTTYTFRWSVPLTPFGGNCEYSNKDTFFPYDYIAFLPSSWGFNIYLFLVHILLMWNREDYCMIAMILKCKTRKQQWRCWNIFSSCHSHLHLLKSCVIQEGAHQMIHNAALPRDLQTVLVMWFKPNQVQSN